MFIPFRRSNANERAAPESPRFSLFENPHTVILVDGQIQTVNPTNSHVLQINQGGSADSRSSSPAKEPGQSSRIDHERSQVSSQRQEISFQRYNDIYKRHLIPKGRGFPLWLPNPNPVLHLNYRRMGVRIGDVGIITEFGGFLFLFNICLPHNDPVNPRMLPEHFAPISSPIEVIENIAFKNGSHLASASVLVKRQLKTGSAFSDIVFESSASEGAILIMPQGARSEDLEISNLERFRDYAAANAANWYRFANGPCGLEAKNGDLRLVVGCDKTTSWGIATFQAANQTQQNSYHFNFDPWDGDSSAYAGLDNSGFADIRTGPYLEEIDELRIDSHAPDVQFENQCLFVRTYNLTLEDDIWADIHSSLTRNFIPVPPRNRQPGYSASDIVDSDKSEHSLGATTCWIAAEHALQHVRNNMSLISEVFDRSRIRKSEYVVRAGFDESLIKSGVGFLEQIHVFILAEVDTASPLLSELGKLFSPFSSILFTESSSYRLPVFKDDGSLWEFDELVYFTASKLSDGGSSAKTPLTIISLSQTPNLADGTSVSSGFSQSNSGSGEGEKNKKRRLEKGKGRDTGDDDEAEKDFKDNKDPSDNPGDPSGNQGVIFVGPAKISFEIASEVHLIQDKRNTVPNTFQTLTMHGCLTIETTPLAQNPPRFSERLVQFTKLTIDTEPPTDTGIAYKQIYLRVIADSQQENAYIDDIKPKRTSDSDGEERRSTSTKSAWTRGVTAGLTLGPHPQGAITSTLMNRDEETARSEKKRYNSAITEHHGDGNVRWGFKIDDVNLQKWGIDMQDDILPSARFEFVGNSKVPAPPPKCMDIVITSCWSMILPSESKSTWIHKLFRFFKSTGNANNQTITYSNLFQIVALKADLSDVPESSHYRAKVKVRSGNSGPPDIKRQASDSVNVIPAVVDDLQNLSAFNLPTIAKLRLSDFCNPILENSGCDSTKSH